MKKVPQTGALVFYHLHGFCDMVIPEDMGLICWDEDMILIPGEVLFRQDYHPQTSIEPEEWQ